MNRPVDVVAAQALTSTFIEAVIAPAIEEAARPVLAAKQNMRVVTTDYARAYEPVNGREPQEDSRSCERGAPRSVTEAAQEPVARRRGRGAR